MGRRKAMTKLEDFLPVDASTMLTQHPECPYDVYLKINTKVILSEANSNFPDNSEVLQKYVSKGVEKFYLTKEDYKLFMTHVNTNMLYETFGDFDYTNRVRVKNQIYDIAKNALSKVGLADTSVSLENIAKDTLSSFQPQSTNAILRQFREFQENSDYGFALANLTLMTASILLKKQSWSTDAMVDKVAKAVLMKDILLSDKDIMLISAGLVKPEEVRHPEDIYVKLKGEKEISSETLAMIRDHHERPDGTGFPRKLNASNITPLSAVVIISEAFVVRLMEKNFNKNSAKRIVVMMRQEFSKGSFSTFYRALKGMVEL